MLKVLSILILFYINIFASADAKLSSNEITLGESVTLTLSGSGENVKFPDVLDIAGFEIESSGQSQNISIINGTKSINISKNFTFTPTKSVVIPSFDIEVDGIKYATKPIELKVVKLEQSSGNQREPDFTFEVIPNKKEAFIGEPIKLDIIFKRHRRTEVMDIQYSQANFPDFWAKPSEKEQTFRDGNYIVHKLTFSLFPQKVGDIKIEPVKIRVATAKKSRDIFGFLAKTAHWRTLFSNELEFKIKPIPENVNLVGNFELEVEVDKKEVDANEPVNLTLKVKGEGNLDDLIEFDLNIDNATVYGDKSEKNYSFKDGKYSGIYSKKFAIISERDFKIPSFTLKYFDLNSQTIKTTKSDEIFVKVHSTAKEIKLESAKEVEVVNSNSNTQKEIIREVNSKEKLLYLFLGIFIGIILMLLKNIKKINFEFKKVKLTQSDKELLQKLMPYSHNSEVKEYISKLEENIYQSKSNKIDKRAINRLLNSLNNLNK